MRTIAHACMINRAAMTTKWIAILGCLVSVAFPGSVLGQVRRPRPDRQIPLTDPNEFFERLFGQVLGPDTPDDEAALSKIEITPREESQAGASALQGLLTTYRNQGVTVTKDSQDAKYVSRLVAQLRPLMKNARRYRQVQVWVIETDDTDARSFPGGSIVVFRGLIDFCESEAALVGILGHELSHIDHGHQLYHLRRFKLAEQSFREGFDPRRMMSMGSMMAKMFMRPFRPEEETEADRDGARWAFQLGYDSSEMARVFLKLSERDVHRAKLMPSFLRSHPYHHDRYVAILKQTDTMKAKSPRAPLYVGKQNLQLRISRKEERFEE